MTDRAAIARNAAAGLRNFAAASSKRDMAAKAATPAATPATKVLIGFDGFVDSIIQVVDKRHDVDRYDPMPTIDHFGRKIVAAAGQSSNYELITTLEKLGGNGPIMANAMAAAGLDVTYIGTLGSPALHPVFEEFATVAQVHSVAEPGYTDALEFTDGKLMLGKYTSVAQLDWEQVAQAVPEPEFEQIVHRSRLIGMVNWTMLARIETVWEKLEELLSHAASGERSGEEAGPPSRPFIFIDLADPEKRTDEDLRGALNWTTRLDAHANVILGLNLKESTQAAAVLDIAVQGDPEAAIESTARALRDKLNVHAVVVHPRAGAAAAVRAGDETSRPNDTGATVTAATFAGPFTAKPKLSTGAGDNFNAGFCLGQLAGLPVEQCLCAGTGTSGFYVRNGYSPSLNELADFCDHLPEPE